MHNVIDALADLRCPSATGQNMLRTDELRGFRKDCRGPHVHQTVTDLTDQGIGRQTAGHIRTATLGSQHQLADGELLTPLQRRLLHHFSGCSDRLLRRGDRTAAFLNDELAHRLVGALLNGLYHQIHLAVLAAQWNDDGAVNIRIRCESGYGVHGQLHIAGHL